MDKIKDLLSEEMVAKPKPTSKLRAPLKVPSEEMAKIKHEYITADPDKKMSYNWLAEKYQIKPIDFAYYCKKNNWSTERKQYIAERQGEQPFSSKNRVTDSFSQRLAEFITEDNDIATETMIVTKDSQEQLAELEDKGYTEKLNKQHLLMLRSIRENIALSLDLTPEAMKIYRRKPILFIQKLQNLTLDSTENQNYYRLVNILLDTMQKERALLGMPTSVKASDATSTVNEEDDPLMNLHLFETKGAAPQLTEPEAPENKEHE